MTNTYDLSGDDMLFSTVHSFVGTARAINFNSTNTDTLVPIVLPQGVSRYAVNAVWINNASASISTATISVRTGAGGTGATIAAAQAITVTATATDTVNNAQ